MVRRVAMNLVVRKPVFHWLSIENITTSDFHNFPIFTHTEKKISKENSRIIGNFIEIDESFNG